MYLCLGRQDLQQGLQLGEAGGVPLLLQPELILGLQGGEGETGGGFDPLGPQHLNTHSHDHEQEMCSA